MVSTPPAAWDPRGGRLKQTIVLRMLNGLRRGLAKSTGMGYEWMRQAVVDAIGFGAFGCLIGQPRFCLGVKGAAAAHTAIHHGENPP